MLKKIRIQRVSIFDIVATLVLAVEVTAVAIAAAEELPKSRKKPPETKP